MTHETHRMMPKRIQRKRTKGWRMPTNAIYVGRPTIFGNPYSRSAFGSPKETLAAFEEWLLNSEDERAVRARKYLSLLQGVDLACWCREGEPCHADVLLRLANEQTEEATT